MASGALQPAETPPNPQPNAPLLAPHPAVTASALPSSQTVAHPLHAEAQGHRHLPEGFSADLAHRVVASGQSRAELILEPAELGRLRFDLITRGEQVQVTLSAERPETMDLLRRHAEDLRQEFRAAGLDSGTLNFSQWGGGAERQSQSFPMGDGSDAPPEEPASFPLQATLASARRTASASGLDLRL